MRLSSFALALSLALGTSIAPLGGFALAQESAQAPTEKQVALTDQQIQNFIAAQEDINAILEKVPQGAQQPDPKILAALDDAAKKHGFANYADFSAVAGTISLVMAGFDPQTKRYIGAEAAIRLQINAVEGDRSMKPEDKKEALDELHLQLKSPPPAALPGNIALVTKYYDKLAGPAQQGQE
ncbi:MAG TPA: hypothetical protein VKV77_01890 [Methylovirgula sp.]|nr:hypothetical protein [Methylovirgula sp.]